MENKMILNLRMEEVGNTEKIYSLIALVSEKLKQLEFSGIEVEYFELRLKQKDFFSTLAKEAYIKIDANNHTFTGNEVSNFWDDAVKNLCDKIKNQFLACKTNISTKGLLTNSTVVT
ncbi:MAG TPA: hypothetical protein VK084_10410 [Chitinophagaceae bacterium]|nr:hypothetical protein [Chitinophagaceae bacterium]